MSKHPNKQAAKPAVEPQPDIEFIYGRHAVLSVLKSEAVQRVNKIFMLDTIQPKFANEIQALAKDKRLILQKVPKAKLEQLTKENHQGIVVSMAPIPYATLEDLFARAAAKQEDPLFVILDNLEDPHNLGSILRTCDAMGVHGVIIPKRRSASLTDIVAKTSTGAVNYVPVARVTNLAQTIQKLKDQGVWIFGTAMTGADYRTWNAKGATALVIGNEGKGISPNVAKQMDATLSIPMQGHVQSLNASVAAGVLLYQAYNSRHPLEVKS
ncbi:23S rRNA (guanosine(2251)-2'-O)-methyltransferase RlmB [Agrilactobacillus fermenti]|uniref:23S rRNA (guanosine(2251)-2'-O)-methyltransferase RlmB n=1 Tax=Agrilactobacillus fermenti TaxID=2586909 RepID=UPI001E508C58|nr:23S rRNA (guanosine(2251)-2'-O)-methyltransferase RlmB [Agrilactobacillus fermenti]MCD2255423.1 23S rRNA (guanosine(2251)-2'-O)-methyltransferase RlmB [Agrilactobacillus fermenti]